MTEGFDRSAARARCDAASDGDHYVRVGRVDWGLVHPLACRPNLTACPVHEACVEVEEPGVPEGFYRVTLGADGVLEYEPTPEPDGDALIQLPADVLALDAEVDALRAERDQERRTRIESTRDLLDDVARLRARAEQAEAERDEALTALGEHVIATEHDRDEYLAMQRLVAERDNEIEALHDAVDRIRGERNAAMALTECAETHGNSEVPPPCRALSGEEGPQ